MSPVRRWPEELCREHMYHCNVLWRATLPRVLIRGQAFGELLCFSPNSTLCQVRAPLQHGYEGGCSRLVCMCVCVYKCWQEVTHHTAWSPYHILGAEKLRVTTEGESSFKSCKHLFFSAFHLTNSCIWNVHWCVLYLTMHFDCLVFIHTAPWFLILYHKVNVTNIGIISYWLVDMLQQFELLTLHEISARTVCYVINMLFIRNNII